MKTKTMIIKNYGSYSLRAETLKWWRSMNTEQKKAAVEEWIAVNPRYHDWNWEFFAMSSSMLEKVYLWQQKKINNDANN